MDAHKRITEKPDAAGHRQRLKKRFLSHGLDGLHDYEALELLLSYAIPRRDVKPVAKELLRKFTTLKKVIDAPLEHLQEVSGVGLHSAVLLKLCRELLILYLEAPDLERQSVTSPNQIANLCRARLEGLSKEQFLVLFLDNRHRLIQSEVIHRGTVDMSVVYPREVLSQALKYQAAAILVAHNHPGGSLTPSADDIKITAELKNAAAVLGIRLLDHLIVAESKVVSLKELNEL
jgi:DNA repair protein RadC